MQEKSFLLKLEETLVRIDPSSRSSSKLAPVQEMYAKKFGVDKRRVACKFLVDSKNYGNRISEACRHAPALLVLLVNSLPPAWFKTFLEKKVLSFSPPVVHVLFSTGSEWKPAFVWTPVTSSLAKHLAHVFGCPIQKTVRDLQYILRSTVESRDVKLDEASIASIVKVINSRTLSGRNSLKYRELQESLEQCLGFPPGTIVCKAIARFGAIGNRIGEAVLSRPRLILLFAEEALRQPIEQVTSKSFKKNDLLKCPVLVCVVDNHPVRIVPVESSLSPEENTYWRRVLNPPESWRDWSYKVWNEKLLRHCLGVQESLISKEVERLPVSREELQFIVGDHDADPMEIMAAFVGKVLEKLPPRRSFKRFCMNGSGNGEEKWTEKSEGYPHFFAMLWFSCLVANGYPNAEKGFHERMSSLLKRTVQIDCLNERWEKLRDWTRQPAAEVKGIRPLKLPGRSSFRTNIGHSYYLAFPQAPDRKRLAQILVKENLIGFEPPVGLVTELLLDSKGFSKDFRTNLQTFVIDCLKGVDDPRESAFWRAVRQEALDPTFVSKTEKQLNQRTIIAFRDDFCMLPSIGSLTDENPPRGLHFQELDEPIGDYRYYLARECGDIESITGMIVDENSSLIPIGCRSMIKQGVLLFRELSDLYVLVDGADVNNASLALVRSDRIEPFLASFKGRAEASIVDGWYQVDDCSPSLQDELPQGLEGVHQLRKTMFPPTMKIIGGVLCSGGFLNIPGLMPKLRAPGATLVEIHIGDGFKNCHLKDHENQVWEYFADVSIVGDRLVQVRATWQGEQAGKCYTRESKKEFILRETHASIDYQPGPAGSYLKEYCHPARLVVQGVDLPLRMVTSEFANSPDLIFLDPSVRFLGPGLGEMDTNSRSDYDWLAVGHKNNPELLVFIGDPDQPIAPIQRQSPSKGDRRHWIKAFRAPKTVVRTENGVYQPFSKYRQLERVREAYQKHRVEIIDATCRPTNLQDKNAKLPGRIQPVAAAWLIVDALAALSCRRKGIPYRTVQQIIATVTNRYDFLFNQQLIRSLEETMALDILLHEDRSLTTLVARKPIFVCSRRGPKTEATLMGLVPKWVYMNIRADAEKLELEINESHAGNIWQTPLLRLRGAQQQIEELSFQHALSTPQWLDWQPGKNCENLNMDITEQSFTEDSLSQFFKHDANWSWDEVMFRRGHPIQPTKERPVTLSRWTARGSCPFYVVADENGVFVRTRVRNWALLAAYELSGESPFTINLEGWISSAGCSPVHLPLPVGRICAAIGVGVPGPIVNSKTHRVEAYCYPFGERLTRFVQDLIPRAWIQE